MNQLDENGFEIVEDAPPASGPRRDAMGFEIVPEVDQNGFEIVEDTPKPGVWERVKAALRPGLQAMGEALAQDPEANEAAGDAIRTVAGQALAGAQQVLESAGQAASAMPGALPGAAGPNPGRALAHPLTPMVQMPRVGQDPGRSNVGQVGAGAANVAAGVVEGLLSPVGVAALGTGALPVAAQRAVVGVFGADMITKLPELAAEAGAASVEGTLQQKVEAFGNLGATAAMAGLAGRHALTPKSVANARTLAEQLDRADLQRAAAPVVERLDRPFPSPAEEAAAQRQQPPRPPEPPPATAGPARPATEALPPRETPSASPATPPESGGGVMGSPIGLPAGTTPTTGARMPVAVNRVVPGTQDLPGIFSQLERVMQLAGSNTPIRTGRMGAAKRWASGFFKPREEVIRLQSAFNLPTATHEVAHSLSGSWFARPAGHSTGARFFNSPTVPRPVRAELRALGQRLYGTRRPAAGYLEEGWAEYVRHHLTTDEAATVAPATHQWFRQVLGQHPEVARELAKARDMIDVWRGQGDAGRAEAMMKPRPTNVQRSVARIRETLSRQAQVEQLTPLEQASRYWQQRTGRPLPPGQDPFLVGTRVRGIAPSVMDRFIHRSPVDIDGNPTGAKPLADVLAPLLKDFPWWQRAMHSVAPPLARQVRDRVRDFKHYLWARRTLERAGREQETGLSVDDARTLIARLDSPQFQLAADGYYRWWDSVLDYYAGAGPAAAELVNAIRAGSEDYVPLPRVIDPAGAKRSAAGRPGGGLHRMQGSGRPIYDIMESTMQVAEGLIERAHRELVANTVIDLSRLPGMGWLVEEVPRDLVRQSVSIEKIRAELEAMGVDTSNVAPDALLEWWTPAKDPKGVDPVFPRRTAGGEIKWYALKPDLYEVLAGVDNPRAAANAIAQFAALSTRIFKLGTTGLRPAFNLVTNPLRDAQNFWMQVNGTANPARALGALMASVGDMLAASVNMGRVRPSAYWEALHDLGVPMANSVAHDISQTRSALRGAWHGKSLRLITEPVNTFRELIGGFETVPRAAQLRIMASEMGWRPGNRLTRDQAVALSVAAKRVTTDFTAGGSVGRQANLYIPFYNAAIQGTRATARTARAAVDPAFADRAGVSQRQALGRIALGGAAMMTLALGNWLRNRDKEWYRALPWRERFLFTNIEDDDGATVWRIPRPIDWGNLFMVLPEAIADSWYRQDPETATKAIEHIVANSNPVGLPVPVNAALEQYANKDFFWDRPIVPRGEVDLPPGEQRSEYSSEFARALGNAWPDYVSPRRVDALIRQLGGGAPGDIINALGLGGKVRQRDEEPADLPVVGTLFRRGGTYTAANRYLSEFYDIHAHFQSRKRSKDRPLDPNEEAFVRRLEWAKDQMDAIKAVGENAKELKVRQSLWRDVGLMAKDVVEDARTAKLWPRRNDIVPRQQLPAR